MKYSGFVDIKKPRDVVVQYFADPAYLGEYQDGFQRKELESGKASEDGAVSKMFYAMGKHEMILTETITANRLPERFEAFYHHKHMDNTMTCRFEELSEAETRYHWKFEYVRMSFMPKLMGIIFPSMYRKQGEKWMRQFKDFVEKKASL